MLILGLLGEHHGGKGRLVPVVFDHEVAIRAYLKLAGVGRGDLAPSDPAASILLLGVHLAFAPAFLWPTQEGHIRVSTGYQLYGVDDAL